MLCERRRHQSQTKGYYYCKLNTWNKGYQVVFLFMQTGALLTEKQSTKLSTLQHKFGLEIFSTTKKLGLQISNKLLLYFKSYRMHLQLLLCFLKIS